MAELEFPVTFDLRVIYTLEQDPPVHADLLAVFARLEVPCSEIVPRASKPGAKYGRLGAKVTFKNVEQLRAAYEGIGALPYVKSLI